MRSDSYRFGKSSWNAFRGLALRVEWGWQIQRPECVQDSQTPYSINSHASVREQHLGNYGSETTVALGVGFRVQGLFLGELNPKRCAARSGFAGCGV